MYSSAVSHWMCGLLLSVTVRVSLAQQPCTDQLDNVPYITFMGERLPNNAFVDIQQISNTENTTVQCHTDLSECCDPSQHSHTGVWVLPNGAEVMHGQTVFGYTATGTERRIDLTYNTLLNSAVEGVFICTVFISGTPIVQQSVYVGIYSGTSKLVLEDSMANIPTPTNFNFESPQFTVSCTSSGGPVGCVQWLRDGVPIATPQTTSTLIDPEEGRYVHVLTVNEQMYGSATYTCDIYNSKPDVVHSIVRVNEEPATLKFFIEQTAPTSIMVQWVSPYLHDETGFRITYNDTGGSSGSVDIPDRDTDNHLFTGLKNGANYTMFIATTSTDPNTLPSLKTQSNLLQMLPGVPMLRLYSVTSDAVSISWTVPAGSVVNSYDVQWKTDSETLSTFHVTLSPTSFNNYTVTGLESYSSDVTITISVTAHNAAGCITSPSVNVAGGLLVGQNREREKSDEQFDTDAIAGAIVGGCVAITIAIVMVALLIYCHWSKNKRVKISSLEHNPVHNNSNTQTQSPAQENGPHLPVESETVLFYNSAYNAVGIGEGRPPAPVRNDDVMNDSADDGYDDIHPHCS